MNDLEKKLYLRLGINPSQIDTDERSCGKPMPDFWHDEIDRARKHILSVLPLDISHWTIPIEILEKIIDEYTIVGSWRKTRRQLGNCNYTKKIIRVNLGYMYSQKGETPQSRMYNTLLHEYVHAILYLHYGRSQNHNENFKFYLRLLNGKS
jgi:hypothetical protein|tara:strand:+ start:2692 stop:3144 length:453 start_codon:yes stop_codon:yes gene_type:complete